jgi:hypothetical protein
MLTVAGQAATASRVVSTEVALPADATDEVLVVIESLSTCEPSLIPRAGVLIDDLRLE